MKAIGVGKYVLNNVCLPYFDGACFKKLGSGVGCVPYSVGVYKATCTCGPEGGGSYK